MKKELKCEFCKSEITVDDKKCPYCGANCLKVIREYNKAIEDAEQEKRNIEIEKEKKDEKFIGTVFTFHWIIVAIIFIIGIGIIFAVAINVSKKTKHTVPTIKTTTVKNIVPTTTTKQHVEVGYNEKAITANYEVTLLSYDLYEYSSQFDTYKTKSGYQKIAFEFEVKNLKSSVLTDADISLKANGYNVEESKLNVDSHFGTLKQGKGNYPEIKVFMIEANDIQKGYIGFEVPKDKKELEFKVGNYVTIKMDNPAYSE